MNRFTKIEPICYTFATENGKEQRVRQEQAGQNGKNDLTSPPGKISRITLPNNKLFVILQ